MNAVPPTTIFTILYDYLGMSKVGARWILNIFTSHQKQRWVVVCYGEFLNLCSVNGEDILDRIVTGDTTWILHYELESKPDTTQWKKKGHSPEIVSQRESLWLQFFRIHKGSYWSTTKEKVSHNNGGLCWATWKIQKSPERDTANKWTKGVLHFQDNAPVPKVRAAKAAVWVWMEYWINPHINLAPNDYYLFPKTKTSFGERKWRTVYKIYINFK